MTVVKIEREEIRLPLTQAIGSIRIADQYGNHIRKPTTEGKNEGSNYVEWMISNAEIERLISHFLEKEDSRSLNRRLKNIDRYLKGSKFAVRKATKEKLDESFIGFEVFKYSENFYSFERTLDSDIRIRLTFKMGAFVLAVHMFVLLPFDCDAIKLFNKVGEIAEGDYLDSGAYAIWSPNKKDVLSIIEGLAHASDSHKNDLISML